MKETPKDNSSDLVIGISIFVAILLVGLFARRFAVLLLFIASLGTLIGVIFYFIRYAIQRGKKNTLEGKVEQLLEECAVQINKHQREITDIRENIRDLEKQIYAGQDINPKTKEESERILAAFKKEYQLRQTKIAFYETCRSKLENIRYNHQLALALEDKQKKLSQLQEDHHQDIARMEQLRIEVAYEKDFLEPIGQLSLRMASINSQDTADDLQLELQEITKELKRL